MAKKRGGLPIRIFGNTDTAEGAAAMDAAYAAEERRYWRKLDKNYAKSAAARETVDAAQQKVTDRLQGESARAQYLGEEMMKGATGPEPRVRVGGKSGTKALLGKLSGTRYRDIGSVLLSFGDEGGTPEEITASLQKHWRKYATAQLSKNMSAEAKTAALDKIAADVQKITPDRVSRMLEKQQFRGVVSQRMEKGVVKYGAGKTLVDNQKNFQKVAQAAARYTTGRSVGGIASMGAKKAAMSVGMGVAGRWFLPLWIGAMLWDATVGRSNQETENAAGDVARGESLGNLILSQGRAARAEGAIRGAEGRLSVDQLVGGRFQELAAAAPPPDNDPDELFGLMMGGASGR